MTRESLELLGIAKSAVPIFLHMLESAVAYYGEDRVDIQNYFPGAAYGGSSQLVAR